MGMISIFTHDLSYALRMLRKQPAYTALAIVALTLGIGANTAIFSIVRTVLLRPLPVRDQRSLMFLWTNNVKKGWPQAPASLPNVLDWRQRTRTFETLSLTDGVSMNLIEKDHSEPVPVLRVSAEFFDTIGVQARFGRTFRAGEDELGHEQVAVISHGMWKQHFGADPKALGKTVVLNGKTYEVIGVMPPLFDFPFGHSFWVPLAATPQQRASEDRGHLQYIVLGRLKPGVSKEAAQKDMDGIATALDHEYPDANAGFGITIMPVGDAFVSDVRTMLWVAQGAAAFVLLIACANIANLLLARGATRRREIAIRLALGASRARVIGQLLMESTILAVIGGGFGILVGSWVLDLIMGMAPEDLPLFWRDLIRLDGSVLLFTTAVALITGIVFGLAPAWAVSRPDVAVQLGGGRDSGSPAKHRLRSILVVSEVALALVLLIGAGLMMQTVVKLHHVDPGFEPRGVATMDIALPDTKYKTNPQHYEFYAKLLARISRLPQVRSASVINELPISDTDNISPFFAAGMPPPTKDDRPTISFRNVDPQYFATMAIRLENGRTFTNADGPSAQRVCVVSREAVKRYWPGAGADPIGRQVKLGDAKSSEPWLTVVGIVHDVRHSGLNANLLPMIYVPIAQQALPNMTVVIRASGDPLKAVAAARAELTELDAGLTATGVQTMEKRIGESIVGERFMSWLLGVFGMLALTLSAVGIYAVVSYAVTERTREIGIRMALGARHQQVLRMVIRQGLRLAGAGIAIGLAGAFGLTQLLSEMLFGVTAADTLTYVALCVLLASVAALASLIPARRATRVDPLIALRYE